MDVNLKQLLISMRERLFLAKEPYLKHLLKKELGRIARRNLRENLEFDDIIIYTDFSKGLC